MKIWHLFTRKKLRRWLSSQNEWSLLVAIVVALVFTAIVDTNHTYFFRPLESLRDIARNSAMLGIFALGAAVVIIAGGIDLSSGSMIALSGTVCSVTMLALAPTEMMAFQPVGWVVVLIAVLASLVTGFFVGTLHTWLITVVRLPPFIATLATLVGLRSFARALCESSTAVLTPTKSAVINVADPVFKTVRDNVWFSVGAFLVLACITCNNKKPHDFDMQILATEKLHDNENRMYVREKIQGKNNQSSEIEINVSNFEIAKLWLIKEIDTHELVEFSKALNSISYECREKTGHGSQQSVRNYINTLTSESAPFEIIKEYDEDGKCFAKLIRRRKIES